MSVNNLPTVSICTPTFNRRPFINYIINCVKNQTYPLDKIEWIIIDDGTDPIGDLFEGITFVSVKYVYLEKKMTLGNKRNLMHSYCTGDIIVYMDDDDYYPPERVSHAVEILQKNKDILIAGSSIINIYFKGIGKMYQFGPYGEYHATAATFAFKKELLSITKYDGSTSVAEESFFLKNYTIPMVQLDTMKTILVFSHIHNSVNKEDILNQCDLSSNPFIKEVSLVPRDFIKDEMLYLFYVDNVNTELSGYDLGHPSHKPDVLLNFANNKMKFYENRIKNMEYETNSLRTENEKLRHVNKLLTERLKSLIDGNINKHRTEWNIER
jgi:glycosyltransferase involved in cell wall biosynthesis